MEDCDNGGPQFILIKVKVNGLLIKVKWKDVFLLIL